MDDFSRRTVQDRLRTKLDVAAFFLFAALGAEARLERLRARRVAESQSRRAKAPAGSEAVRTVATADTTAFGG